MRFLSGVACPELLDLEHDGYDVGVMGQPGSYGAKTYARYNHYAFDNGCFTRPITPGSSDERRWRRWLDRQKAADLSPLFMVLPDVPFDADATLRRFWYYRHRVDYGWPVAFVLQNGCERPGMIPWNAINVVFIGGDTAWKVSHHALYLTWQAKDRGLYVHAGRVNSRRRMMRMKEMCEVDSCDGNFLRQPKNAARLRVMLDRARPYNQLALA